MLTVVHGSDVHFGSPHLPAVAEIFVEAVASHAPDLLALSGDLTQRAKVSEFEAAAEWLDGFGDLPVVVTPGNHDVPLYRVVERFLDPYRNWRKCISPELNSVTRVPGITAVALNSADPRRAIVNGRLRSDQLEFARRAFRESPEDDVKLLVMHHHLVPAPDYQADRPMPGARRLLLEFEAMGVEVVLSGHLHRAYIGNSIDASPKAGPRDRMLVVHSGTTTSSRGRAREHEKNSYNLLQFHETTVEVVHHLLDPTLGRFVPTSFHRFPRRHVTELLLEHQDQDAWDSMETSR